MQKITVLAASVAITIIFVSVPVFSQEVQGLYELNKHAKKFKKVLQTMQITKDDFESKAKSLRKKIMKVKEARDKFGQDSPDWLDKNADLIEMKRQLSTARLNHRKKIKRLAEKGKKALDMMKKDLERYEKQQKLENEKGNYHEIRRKGCKNLAFATAEIFENAKILGLKNDERVKIKMASTKRIINRLKRAKKSRERRIANLDGFKEFIYHAEEIIDTTRFINLSDLDENVEELDFIKTKALENLIASYQKKINKNLKQAEKLLSSSPEIDDINLSPTSSFFKDEEVDINESITQGWE